MCSLHVIKVHCECRNFSQIENRTQIPKLFLAGHVLGDLSRGTFKLFIMITRDSG